VQPRGIARSLGDRLRGAGGSVDRRFLLPIGAAFCGFLGIGAIVPVLPAHMRSDLGSHDVEIGFVIGAYSIGALGSRILSGRLVDARGGMMSVKLGLVLSSLAGLLFVLPLGLPGLVAGRMAQGVGAAFVFGGAAALIVALAPVSQRAKAMGLLGVGPWGALAVGPLIGGLIGSFAGTAVFVLILPLPVLALAVRWRPGDSRGRAQASAGPARLLPPEAMLPGAALGLISIGQITLTGFLALRLAEVGGGGPLAYGAYATGVLATRILLSSVVDRSGPVTGMLIGCLCAAAGMAIVAFAPATAVGVIGAVVCGIGFGFPWLALLTFTFNRVRDQEKGAALGVLTAVSDGANVGGALVAGLVAETFGYPAVFLYGALSILASAGLIIPAMRQAGGAAQPTAELVPSQEAGAADR
jgi:MFS family permease